MPFINPTFVSLAFSLGAYAALGPVTDLNIINGNISPDGYTRSAVLPEGVFPGPVISGYKGDNFRINVTDGLTDETMLLSTSVHMHGIYQKTTNYNDGPVSVNQCPISKGDSYVYDFNVTDQAGTYWYHSHLATQYCDGLRGPLIIYDPNDPHASLYDVDDESTIITLADWYHVVSPAAGNKPTPDSTLINGLGRYKGGPASPLAVVNVTYGTRYRFRLIGMACTPNYVFSIDSHMLNVIEVDGVNVTPLMVDSIQVFAGQRYSFVLTANQIPGNYWIRAQPNEGTTSFSGGLNSAILRYSGALVMDPLSIGITNNLLNEQYLAPLVPTPAPGAAELDGADYNLNLALGFSHGAFTMNGAVFVPPSVPILLQILSGATDAADLLPSASIYTLPANKSIQISMPGMTIGGAHPFHLHGHTFSVIRSAGNDSYNYVNPPQRDVVSVGGPDDNVTIRFVTDNSGPWFLHCHIDWHAAIGFGVVFAEDTGSVASNNVVPTAWTELCPKYNALDASELGGVISS